MSSLNKQPRMVSDGELTLALNAAEGRLQLVLGRKAAPGGRTGAGVHRVSEPEILVAQDWQAASQGAELLAPALEQALGNLKLLPCHIGRIAVVNGPGSFTGLRLVCVTASALARSLKAGQAAIGYLPLLAAGAAEALSAIPGDLFWVLAYARRGLVCVQGFEARSVPEGQTGEALYSTPAALDAISELTVLPVESAADFLAAHLKNTPGRHYVLGSGLSKNINELRSGLLDCGATPLSFRHDQPSAAALMLAALEADYGTEDVAPLYVRPSDAEENLPQIAARLGLDEGYALRRLEELLKS